MSRRKPIAPEEAGRRATIFAAMLVSGIAYISRVDALPAGFDVISFGACLLFGFAIAAPFSRMTEGWGSCSLAPSLAGAILGHIEKVDTYGITNNFSMISGAALGAGIGICAWFVSQKLVGNQGRQ